MSIVLFVIILAFLIFVHELGHFLVAKKAGIRVDEFGIGFPPRVWSKRKGETVYSLNAFPVGGFVKIFGENPDEESVSGTDRARSFMFKPKWIQAAVVSAGILFNLLFAWMLLSLGFMVGVPYAVDDSRYGARVEDARLSIVFVESNSPAEVAGLKAGDRILSLAAGSDTLTTPTLSTVQEFIAVHEEVMLSYGRSDSVNTALVLPKEGVVDGRRAIGISMDMTGTLRLPWYEAPIAALATTMSLSVDTAVGLANFFRQLFVGDVDLSAISGPVGIVRIVGDASVLGFAHVIALAALISINLAIVNLLPFPALDGGRLFFIFVETIKGSPIRPSIVNTANGTGFVLLILLMVLITYSDVMKIIKG